MDKGINIGLMSDTWALAPYGDNLMRLGTNGYRWTSVWAQSATIQTSDRNKKKDIEPISEKYISLFNDLKPVSYKFIDGESGRTHIGYISQDVEESMKKLNISPLEFAGFCKDKQIKPIYEDDEKGMPVCVAEKEVLDENGNPVYEYSLRYEEFIALNTLMIQNLQKEVQQLKSQINS
mgnify:CR=1 FL=1